MLSIGFAAVNACPKSVADGSPAYSVRVEGDVRVDGPGPGGQGYVERPPVAALAGVVSSVWIQQVAPDADPYAHRKIPNGAVELVCAGGSVPRVAGPLTGPRVEALAPGSRVTVTPNARGRARRTTGLPRERASRWS
jgi:hypothetical protein